MLETTKKDGEPKRNRHTDTIIRRHRLMKEPLSFAYYGFELVALPGVFCPLIAESGPMMSDYILKSNFSGKEIIEVGSGSGAQSVLLRSKGLPVVAVDLNHIAVQLTRLNLKRHRLNFHAQVIKCNLFHSVGNVKFDVMLADLPFANGPGRDMLEKAFYDPGHYTLRRFLRLAPKYLKSQGRIVLTFSSLGCVETLSKFIRHYKYRIHDLIQTKSNGITWQIYKLAPLI